MLGCSINTVASDLYAFATGSINAKTDGELDRAARHFAKAIVTGGIDVITAILLHQSASNVIGREYRA